MNRTVAIIKYTRHLLLTWCSIGMILCRTGEFPTFHILFTILWIKMHVFSAANSWLNSAGNTLRSSCVCWLCVKWIDDHFMRLADIRRQIDTLIYGWNKRLDKLLSFSAGNVAVVGNNESFRWFLFFFCFCIIWMRRSSIWWCMRVRGYKQSVCLPSLRIHILHSARIVMHSFRRLHPKADYSVK